MMERSAIWQPWDEIGLEHLRLVESESGAIADSLLFRFVDNQSVRLHYEIRVDAAWRVRAADIEMSEPEIRQIKLRSNGCGRWTDVAGAPLDHLNGCVDIDLSATPFTNTLPIRRIRLEVGESAEITVVYISVPELSATPVQQRYTCLEKSDGGGLYRYEGLTTGFTCDLPVDSVGLVVDYPGVFRRLPLSKDG